MKEFLRTLGIDLAGHYAKDGSYVIDIYDSDEFGKIFSKLDRSDEIEELEESSLLTVHNSSQVFVSEQYQLTLISDLDQDTYKLVVKEI